MILTPSPFWGDLCFVGAGPVILIHGLQDGHFRMSGQGKPRRHLMSATRDGVLDLPLQPLMQVLPQLHDGSAARSVQMGEGKRRILQDDQGCEGIAALQKNMVLAPGFIPMCDIA